MVPHADRAGLHVEHFPPLSNASVREGGGAAVLTGFTSDGKAFESKDLVLRGGIGETFEHRVLHENSLVSFLEKAGLKEIVATKNSKLDDVVFESWRLKRPARA
jgi:hypothetical protein